MSTQVALPPAVTSEEVALPPAPTPEEGLVIWASWDEALALTTKARGEVAEMILVPKLMAMGMIVAKPYGDSAPWDLLVQAGNRLSRLQVKSAWVKGEDGYQVATGPSPQSGRKRCYRTNEIDFLVAYLVPEEAWFVFPVRKLRKTCVVIKIDPGWRMAKYRDRWDLLYGSNQSK